MAVSRNVASSRRWRGSDSNDSTNVPSPSMVPPIMTFSSTEAEPTMRGVWNVRAIRMCARRWRANAGSAAPFSLTAPGCGA